MLNLFIAAAQKIENTDASKRNDGTNVPLLPSIGKNLKHYNKFLPAVLS